jgi:hypothetical protein
MNTTCLLVQKYANDRPASLFQISFEIYILVSDGGQFIALYLRM